MILIETEEQAKQELAIYDILLPPRTTIFYEITGLNVHGPFVREFLHPNLDGEGHSHLMFSNMRNYIRWTPNEFNKLGETFFERQRQAYKIRKEVLVNAGK